MATNEKGRVLNSSIINRMVNSEGVPPSLRLNLVMNDTLVTLISCQNAPARNFATEDGVAEAFSSNFDFKHQAAEGSKEPLRIHIKASEVFRYVSVTANSKKSFLHGMFTRSKGKGILEPTNYKEFRGARFLGFVRGKNEDDSKRGIANQWHARFEKDGKIFYALADSVEIEFYPLTQASTS